MDSQRYDKNDEDDANAEGNLQLVCTRLRVHEIGLPARRRLAQRDLWQPRSDWLTHAGHLNARQYCVSFKGEC
jgi:hypothetical protein